MADPIEVGPGRYYDPASGMYWTEATGWYYSSGGDESGGPAATQSTGDPVADAIARALAGDTSSGVTYGEPYYDAAGNYVQNGSNGTIRVINARQTPSTSVHINPADTTGAWSIQYDSTGAGFKINKITGEVIPLGFDKTVVDPNNDGYDDKTGLPVGVVKEGSGSSATYWYKGQRVNRDGSLYQGGSGPSKQEILVDRTGAITGRAGTSYYYDETGTPHTLVTGPTPSTSSGGGGSSSGGGGSSSGGSGSSTPANRTITNIREGGFNDTNLNISELGPEYMANAAAERGMAGLQTAGSLQQKLSELMDARTNNIIQNLSNPSDIVAREYSTRAMNAPAGTATPMYSGTDTLSQIIQRLMAGNPGLATGGGVTPVSGTGAPVGATPTTPGTVTGTPTTPAIGGTNGASTAPVSAAVSGNFTGGAAPGVESRSGVGGMTSGDFAGNAPDLSKFYAGLQKIFAGGPGSQSVDPSQKGYMDPLAPANNFQRNDPGYSAYYEPGGKGYVDPRVAAQAGDDVQRDLTAIPYGEDAINRDISTRSGMPPLSMMANGGATSGEPFIAGDPQSNGKPNPELVIPNGPSTVVPLQDMPQGISQMLMRTMPKHAYGWPEYDPNSDSNWMQGAYGAATTVDPYAGATGSIYDQPPTNTTTQTTAQPVPQNTTTQFGDWRDQLPTAGSTVPSTTTTPGTVSNPSPAVAPQSAPIQPQPVPVSQPVPVQPVSNASNATTPAPPVPTPLSAIATNPTGIGIHPYNGQPADTIMSYPDEAYQNLPSLLFSQGKIPLSQFLASATGGATGAFGTRVPYSGDMNYTNMLNLMRVPGSYAALSSLAKSANLNLDDEVAKARMRAPLGNAIPISGIMT